MKVQSILYDKTIKWLHNKIKQKNALLTQFHKSIHVDFNTLKKYLTALDTNYEELQNMTEEDARKKYGECYTKAINHWLELQKNAHSNAEKPYPSRVSKSKQRLFISPDHDFVQRGYTAEEISHDLPALDESELRNSLEAYDSPPIQRRRPSSPSLVSLCDGEPPTKRANNTQTEQPTQSLDIQSHRSSMFKFYVHHLQGHMLLETNPETPYYSTISGFVPKSN